MGDDLFEQGGPGRMLAHAHEQVVDRGRASGREALQLPRAAPQGVGSLESRGTKEERGLGAC